MFCAVTTALSISRMFNANSDTRWFRRSGKILRTYSHRHKLNSIFIQASVQTIRLYFNATQAEFSDNASIIYTMGLIFTPEKAAYGFKDFLADRPHIINDKLSAFSSLRNILQRGARNASILGGTPLQIQCTFIPSASASAFSNPEDFQCHHFGTFLFSAALRSKFDALSIPSIRILPLFLVLPTQMDCALNSLPHCIDDKETDTVGPAKLGRKELTLKINRAMDDRPHVIDRKPVKIKFLGKIVSLAKVILALFRSSLDLFQKTSPKRHCAILQMWKAHFLIRMAEQLLDKINNVPEAITEEDLIAFYSKYGQLRECRVLKEKLENLALTYLIGYLDESVLCI
ncbi:hypothetical protein Ddc_16628 [Ditylenchus destructor]|nr:hypothetical protein Ddc_16628 [Ditylenchus destructor]